MLNKKITGRAVCLPDYMGSETIISDKYVEITDQRVLGDHCFDAISEDFSTFFPQNGIIVAGKNFGFGSVRDYPVIAIKNMHALAVVAESFDRMFYRNAVNLKLLVVEAPECKEKIKKRDNITIDIENSEIINNTTSEVIPCNKIFVINDEEEAEEPEGVSPENTPKTNAENTEGNEQDKL